jgi:hypothetical protein
MRRTAGEAVLRCEAIALRSGLLAVAGVTGGVPRIVPKELVMVNGVIWIVVYRKSNCSVFSEKNPVSPTSRVG